MTNEQLNRIVLAIDALRIATLATIPAEEWDAAKSQCEASEAQAEASLEPIVDVGVSIPRH